MVKGVKAMQRRIALQSTMCEMVESRSDRHAGGALEFAPANPGAFDGAEDCFPDAVTEHWPIDQAHRQNSPGAYDRLALEQAGERGEEHIHRQEDYDEWQHRGPDAKWQ